jgi:hypothetical protein
MLAGERPPIRQWAKRLTLWDQSRVTFLNVARNLKR